MEHRCRTCRTAGRRHAGRGTPDWVPGFRAGGLERLSRALRFEIRSCHWRIRGCWMCVLPRGIGCSRNRDRGMSLHALPARRRRWDLVGYRLVSCGSTWGGTSLSTIPRRFLPLRRGRSRSAGRPLPVPFPSVRLQPCSCGEAPLPNVAAIFAIGCELVAPGVAHALQSAACSVLPLCLGG